MFGKPLTLFGEVQGGYQEWLDGFVPDHPYFDKDALIQAIVLSIKDLLFQNILAGCAELLKVFRPQNADLLDMLTRSLSHNPVLWKAVISAHKYGVIYLCSRAEARNLYLSVTKESTVEAHLIDGFLSQDSSATRAINYGVRQYIHSDTIETTRATCFVPPYAISSSGRFSLQSNSPSCYG